MSVFPAPVAVMLYDETLSGTRTPALSLSLISARISLRELLRRRVYEEVQLHNAAPSELPFRGFVTPTAAERLLNGEKPAAGRRFVDWEAQFARACEAFERNGFFVLVDDRQVEHLDDELTLTVSTTISFVKLVPLVGG